MTSSTALARLCPRGQTATSDGVGKGACEVVQFAPHRDAPLPTLQTIAIDALIQPRVVPRAGIAQPIADAEFRQQDLGPVWINLDFLSQLAHEDPQVLRVVDMRLPPHRLEQVLVRYDFSRVLGEDLEQAILFGRKVKAFTLQLHRTGCKVDDKAIQPQRTLAVLALALTPQDDFC